MPVIVIVIVIVIVTTFAQLYREHLRLKASKAEGSTSARARMDALEERVQEKILRAVEYGDFQRVDGAQAQADPSRRPAGPATTSSAPCCASTAW